MGLSPWLVFGQLSCNQTPLKGQTNQLTLHALNLDLGRYKTGQSWTLVSEVRKSLFERNVENLKPFLKYNFFFWMDEIRFSNAPFSKTDENFAPFLKNSL